MCKQIASRKLLYNRELSLVLCDDLEGWDEGEMGGRLNTEGIHTHTHTRMHIYNND